MMEGYERGEERRRKRRRKEGRREKGGQDRREKREAILVRRYDVTHPPPTKNESIDNQMVTN